jgi:NAD(P)-dependent dehydrogenase (short-subunit alcohol dehydrogenase family)
MSKTIIVTGGSRGIGRAAALLCGLRGWSVVVNYVGAEAAARETARAIEAAGAAALVVQGDMSVEADVARLFAAATERFGVIDGLVNNAGIVAPGMSFVDMEAARWRRIFDLNVIGALLCAQAAARRFDRQHFLGRRASGLARPLCRLRRLERRDRLLHARARHRACARGRARQRHPPGHDRD